jgi:hypothetical protein
VYSFCKAYRKMMRCENRSPRDLSLAGFADAAQGSPATCR